MPISDLGLKRGVWDNPFVSVLSRTPVLEDIFLIVCFGNKQDVPISLMYCCLNKQKKHVWKKSIIKKSMTLLGNCKSWLWCFSLVKKSILEGDFAFSNQGIGAIICKNIKKKNSYKFSFIIEIHETICKQQIYSMTYFLFKIILHAFLLAVTLIGTFPSSCSDCDM